MTHRGSSEVSPPPMKRRRKDDYDGSGSRDRTTPTTYIAAPPPPPPPPQSASSPATGLATSATTPDPCGHDDSHQTHLEEDPEHRQGQQAHDEVDEDGEMRKKQGLRIYAWNINGIRPFIQSFLLLKRQKGLRKSRQRGIGEFFSPTTAAGASEVNGIAGSGAEDDGGRRNRRRRRERGRRESHSRSSSSGATSTDDDDGDKKQGRGRPTGDDGNHQEDEEEAPPSLRDFLRRHDWPEMLLLQEVKIALHDTESIKAVRVAVNHSVPPTASLLSEPPSSTTRASASTTRSSGKGIEIPAPNDNGPAYEAHFTLANDPYNARGPRGSPGAVYGVASIIRSDFARRYVSRVRSVPWDVEGRISIIETHHLPLRPRPLPHHHQQQQSPLPDPHHHRLAIINIYAVNGTSLPYRSPTTGHITGTRHTHKRALHKHLLREVLSLQSHGYVPILAGDMNVARHAIDGHPRLRVWPREHVVNRADFEAKFFDPDNGEGLRGLDTFRLVHGMGRRGYSYYPRGGGKNGVSLGSWGESCDRVDYVIVGRGLEGFVKGAGIGESRWERGPSDHCPVWVDVG